MEKKIFTSFCFCFFLSVLFFNTSAQEYKYDISKYYTPDIVRNQLDVSFNTNNTFNNSKSKQDTTSTTFSTGMNGTFTPIFNSYTNTRKRLTSLQINGQFNGSYNSSGLVNESNPYKDFNSDDNLSVNYSNHFYNSKNQFFEVGISSNFQTRINNFTEDINPTKGSYQEYYLNFTPSIGIGTGRIEAVEDARQAIYILDDLSKKGVLTRQLNDEEIFRFAQQISRVKNKRFLDARLHLMDEITSVDSFLVNNNLLNKSDARYFTSLYDNWQYGALYSRRSGHTFEITFTPAYNWNFAKNNPGDTINRGQINQNNLTGGLSLVYTYEKPVNLNWQHSVTASLNGNTNFSNYLNQYGNYNNFYETDAFLTFNGYDSRSVSLNGNYTLGFYPNTRTHLSAGLIQNLQFLYFKDLNINSTSWNKEFISNTNLYVSAYYYVSPQLRLSISANCGNYYRNNYSSNFNQLNGGFSGTLSYSFF
jgi:hypothetical protein